MMPGPTHRQRAMEPRPHRLQHSTLHRQCTQPARPASTAPSSMPLARFALNCAGFSLRTVCNALCSCTPQRASHVVHSLVTWWTARMGVHHVKNHCAALRSKISMRRTAAPNARRPGANRPGLRTASHSIAPRLHRMMLSKKVLAAPPQLTPFLFFSFCKASLVIALFFGRTNGTASRGCQLCFWSHTWHCIAPSCIQKIRSLCFCTGIEANTGFALSLGCTAVACPALPC